MWTSSIPGKEETLLKPILTSSTQVLSYMVGCWHSLIEHSKFKVFIPTQITLDCSERSALRSHGSSLLACSWCSIWRKEVSRSFSAISVLTIQTQKIAHIGPTSHVAFFFKKSFPFLFLFLCLLLKDDQAFHLLNEKWNACLNDLCLYGVVGI